MEDKNKTKRIISDRASQEYPEDIEERVWYDGKKTKCHYHDKNKELRDCYLSGAAMALKIYETKDG